MAGYYEPVSDLDQKTRALSHGINTLIEEMEAVDYYNQRVCTCSDEALKEIMAHNRDEELEHAAMALEWLRRQLPALDKELRHYLFTTGDLTHLEAGATEGGADGTGSAGLGIGKLNS